MTLRRLLLVVPIVVLTAAGCAGDGPGTVPSMSSEPSFTASPLSPAASPRPSGSVPPGVVDSPPIQAAIADLAGRLDVPSGDIEVVAVSEVTWSDGSLGCPQPGVNYTQALANGQLVVLAAGGRTYEYHSGPNRPLFYCADPRPPVGGGGAGAGDS